jgi:hypothetical protein
LGTSISARYAVSVAVAILAGCSSGGTQVTPGGPTSQSAALDAIQPGSIVYTQVNKKIMNGGRLKLDIDNNGKDDFEFIQYYYPHYCQTGIGSQLCGAVGGLLVSPRKSGNGTANGAQGGWAAVLPYGNPIDSEVSFNTAKSLMYDYGVGDLGRERPFSNGYWNGVSNEYLGVEIVLHRQIHYGWARLTSGGGLYGVFTTLTGYAYETVAGKSIAAGQTK